MEPQFGVGLKRFLFSNFDTLIYSEIESKIVDQIEYYMPAIKIENIDISPASPDSNVLNIFIEYRIPSIGAQDLLEFTI